MRHPAFFFGILLFLAGRRFCTELPEVAPSVSTEEAFVEAKATRNADAAAALARDSGVLWTYFVVSVIE
jgi:hypothetical protein